MKSLRIFLMFEYQFLAAAAKGDLARVSTYLDNNISKINVMDEETGETALMLAAEAGHLLVVRELLRRGAGIDLCDGYRFTALMKAAKAGHLDVVEELLIWGANPLLCNHQDKGTRTALILCIRSKFLNSISISKQLIMSDPASVNLADINNCTPLMFTADFNKIETMEFLLEHKADIDLQNKRGETALFIASRQNNLAAVQLLLEREADTTLPDIKGQLAEEITQNTDIANLIKAKRPLTLAERLKAIPGFDGDKIPEDLVCPITHLIMTKPTTLPQTKHTFERLQIMNWFKFNCTNPMTNLPVQLEEKYHFPINPGIATEARLFVEAQEKDYADIQELQLKKQKMMSAARERRFFPTAEQNVPSLATETVASELDDDSASVKSTTPTVSISNSPSTP